MREWIISRSSEAPSELLEHLLQDAGVHEVASQQDGGVLTMPEQLVAASERALERVLEATDTSRSVAFDLLAADAFVTYAFEAAADEPATVVARADAAMRRISRQAERYL